LTFDCPTTTDRNTNNANNMKIDFRAVAQLYLRSYPTVCMFREHFGATPAVAYSTWDWLVVSEMIPPKVLPCHLLWLFYWWKANPLQGPICKFLGGVSPNTFQKWRDLMEEAVSNLPVVS
jgi:hypothetical protein